MRAGTHHFAFTPGYFDSPIPTETALTLCYNCYWPNTHVQVKYCPVYHSPRDPQSYDIKTKNHASEKPRTLQRRNCEPAPAFATVDSARAAIHLPFHFTRIRKKKDGLPHPFQGFAMTRVGGHFYIVYPFWGVVLLAMTRAGKMSGIKWEGFTFCKFWVLCLHVRP